MELVVSVQVDQIIVPIVVTMAMEIVGALAELVVERLDFLFVDQSES